MCSEVVNSIAGQGKPKINALKISWSMQTEKSQRTVEQVDHPRFYFLFAPDSSTLLVLILTFSLLESCNQMK